MTKKDIIIKEATRLFASKGFKSTSMAELSKCTNVAEGTIFYHFKNKEDIFITILKHVKNGIIEEFEAYIRNKTFNEPLEMLEDVICFYLYLAGKNEQWFKILNHPFSYDLAENNSVCRNQLDAIYNCIIDIFENAVSQAVKEQTDKTIQKRKIALIIFSMVNGLVWFKLHHLYDTEALYKELKTCCRKILQNA